MFFFLIAVLICGAASIPLTTLPRSTLPPSSPMDFDWIQNYTALGDSYAAGIGAGQALSGPNDFSCSRYDASYPQQLLTSFSNTTVFQNLPCTGDTLQQVIDNQIPLLADDSQDLVTISAGGNDVGFAKIVIACVYGTSGEKGCTDAIAEGRSKMQNVVNNIRPALEKLAPKMREDGVVAWTLYSAFWNATTDACDHETWAAWDTAFGLAGNLKLIKDRRQAMNDLTNELNGKMAAAIMQYQAELYTKQKGDRPLFQVSPVLWSQDVERVHGAFCEQNYDNLHPSPDLCFIKQSGVGYYDPNKKLVNKPGEKAYADPVMQWFHPTEFGQYLISANTLAEIMVMRAKFTGYNLATAPTCSKSSRPSASPEPDVSAGNLTCYGLKSNGWAVDTSSFDPIIPNLDSRVADVCSEVEKWALLSPGPGNYAARITGMGGDIIDDPGVDVSVSWPDSKLVTRASCIAYMERIIGCENWTPDNPFNLKHGGFIEASDGGSGTTRYAIDPRSHGMVREHLVGDWVVMTDTSTPPQTIEGLDRPTLQACITDKAQLNSGHFRSSFECGNSTFYLLARNGASNENDSNAKECWKAMAPLLSKAVDNWIGNWWVSASSTESDDGDCEMAIRTNS